MYENIPGPPMSGLLVSLWMFTMYEYIAAPPMRILSASLWMCSYV